MHVYNWQHDKSMKTNMTEVLKLPIQLSTHENKQNIKNVYICLFSYLRIFYLISPGIYLIFVLTFLWQGMKMLLFNSSIQYVQLSSVQFRTGLLVVTSSDFSISQLLMNTSISSIFVIMVLFCIFRSSAGSPLHTPGDRASHSKHKQTCDSYFLRGKEVYLIR